jgi:hypothetical protein
MLFIIAFLQGLIGGYFWVLSHSLDQYEYDLYAPSAATMNMYCLLEFIRCARWGGRGARLRGEWARGQEQGGHTNCKVFSGRQDCLGTHFVERDHSRAVVAPANIARLLYPD